MLPDETPVIALIPARAGSKGIPRKNLAPVGGVPLLERAVRGACASRWIDEAWVSSDDDTILGLAGRLGARTLRRPAELAGDDATATGVVGHFLEHALSGRRGDVLIVYLQPTSPLRTEHHIDAAIDTMLAQQARAVVAVTRCDPSPYKMFRLDETGRLQSLFDEHLSNASRQSLPAAFVPNGAIYAFSAALFEARGGFPSNGGVPYEMDTHDSIDIDEPEDLRSAERILEGRHARV
jgi:CMP-N,N'-diacetyllegionaminic acid synthase